jgi:hypothetical protein
MQHTQAVGKNGTTISKGNSMKEIGTKLSNPLLSATSGGAQAGAWLAFYWEYDTQDPRNTGMFKN